MCARKSARSPSKWGSQLPLPGPLGWVQRLLNPVGRGELTNTFFIKCMENWVSAWSCWCPSPQLPVAVTRVCVYEDHEPTAALAPRDDAGRRTTNPLPSTCRARRERRFSAQCPCGGRWSSAGPVRSSAPPTAGTATLEEIRVLWCMRNAAPVGWRVSRGPGTGFSGVQLPSADIGAKVRHRARTGEVAIGFVR